MDDGLELRKAGVLSRMARHPMGAFLGGAVAALLCGGFGSIEGGAVAAVMAVVGAVVGAPCGAMLAGSSSSES
jgi:hypothetical protein